MKGMQKKLHKSNVKKRKKKIYERRYLPLCFSLILMLVKVKREKKNKKK